MTDEIDIRWCGGCELFRDKSLFYRKSSRCKLCRVQESYKELPHKPKGYQRIHRSGR